MVIAYVNHDSYHLFTLDIGPTENTLNSVLVGLIIGKFCTPNVMQAWLMLPSFLLIPSCSFTFASVIPSCSFTFATVHLYTF